MAIKENATVMVIDGIHVGKTGKVTMVYDYADIAVVSFDDNGDLGKVSLSALVEVQPQESRIVDVKIEFPEGAKKISRADFDAALVEITSPEKMLESNSNPMSAFAQIMTAKIMGDSVRDKIFEDQDAVIMTEEEFVSGLWGACDPTATSESVKKGLSARECIRVAITAMIGLEEIVGILFGAENG